MNTTNSATRSPGPQELLQSLLATELQIRDYSHREIVFSPPLITMDEVPIIRRGTLNVIQGKQGSNKSRLAEHFASLLIAEAQPAMYSLGFTKIASETVTVAYIDTERSVKEEFPNAVRNIRRNAGFSNDPENFRYTSLKTYSRSKRLGSLKTFIEDVRVKTNNPIFVIIDVITDAIRDFNDPEESMELLDFLGNLCEQTDATALQVIHENPFGDKARGHVGTEAINKAATVMQIGFEKATDEHSSPYLTLKFKKQRHSEISKQIALQFDKETHTLKLANQASFEAAIREKDKKITAAEVARSLADWNEKEIRQKEALTRVQEEFHCSYNTAKSRLKEIADNGVEIVGENCEPCFLTIKASSGTATVYVLQNYKEAS
ncbi:AAA family ATPase [Dyadobacter sp. MSC1_007]|jgi:energy-coupling factor transporter ATP-binding protein EcfA2|uniref:AAA family ATPase n=1 Tax=Dyadobacter sp. MSC1_007 TaxID=2909264 RepID=UPI0020303CC6|nr:AAA family ATPase [Dyadobacter sp. MSC1_007]